MEELGDGRIEGLGNDEWESLRRFHSLKKGLILFYIIHIIFCDQTIFPIHDFINTLVLFCSVLFNMDILSSLYLYECLD